MFCDSLWGEEFTPVETPKQVKKIVKKISQPKDPKVSVVKTVKSKDIPLEDKLKLITDEVIRILGRYKDNTAVIRTYDDLKSYIDDAISNGIIAIDTETNNSLDPITCKLMGGCIYTPGRKNAYIPVNHIDIKTGKKLPNQVTEEQIKEQFSRLYDIKCIYHNGKFDYEVLKCTCGLDLPIYWDTMIGAKVLDENEHSAGLKQQYIDKIDPSVEKYSIDHLFNDIEYAQVDPEIFALYAATDSYMTYKLYEWQLEKFSLPEHKKLFNMFKTIEIPVIKVVAKMELTGVELDFQYADLLSKKYHKILDSIDREAEQELAKIKPKIDAWRLTEEANAKQQNKKGELTGKSKAEQLEDPISLSSPTQLAILLYDILKVKSVSTKSPRGTGEDILSKIDIPLCKIILKRRATSKLIDAFIDALPKTVNAATGRVHCHFNQYGAATGRFSSSEPNLQQIPSHEKSIRMIFKATDGYTLVGSDFSQQEPRLLSQYSQDRNMIDAYKEGKDLYATIASGVYRMSYWDCMEHHEDGTPNPEGKKRRGSVKSLLLGIMYGRGVTSIAEQIHGTIEEAQKIVDDFYQSFPNVKRWIDKTQADAHKTGYVEDLWGRRRRLPDIQLPKYDIKDKSGKNQSTFNPILGCSDRTLINSNIEKYKKLLEGIKNRRDYEAIQKKALLDNIEIHDNTGFIAQAERQCVNARIQGGAASMTKLAMIKLDSDKELNDLGFKLLIGVHDELIGECPIENADAVADRLCFVMKTAAQDVCEVPFKCDPDIATCWYLNDYQDLVRSEFQAYLDKGMTKEQAFDQECLDRPESTREQMLETLEQQLK